jgi:uncharacterized protein (UPF0248 family)
MKTIPLSLGLFATIDDEDYERVSKFKWSAKKDKNKYYALRKDRNPETGFRKTVMLHRFIMEVTETKIHVDHRDGDGLMNTRGNLRLCSNQQNAMNRKPYKGTASGYKGVRPSSKSSWLAIVIKNKQHHYLGVFPNPEAAARAYDKKAKELFGEFANLNFPNE